MNTSTINSNDLVSIMTLDTSGLVLINYIDILVTNWIMFTNYKIFVAGRQRTIYINNGLFLTGTSKL